jgi:hypothetical protein
MPEQLDLFDQPEASAPPLAQTSNTLGSTPKQSGHVEFGTPERAIAWWSDRFTGDPAECLDELFAETC